MRSSRNCRSPSPRPCTRRRPHPQPPAAGDASLKPVPVRAPVLPERAAARRKPCACCRSVLLLVCTRWLRLGHCQSQPAGLQQEQRSMGLLQRPQPAPSQTQPASRRRILPAPRLGCGSATKGHGDLHPQIKIEPMRPTSVIPVPRVRVERRGGSISLRSRGRAWRGAGNCKKDALPEARARRASSARLLAIRSRRRRSYSLSDSGSASQQHSRRETI